MYVQMDPLKVVPISVLIDVEGDQGSHDGELWDCWVVRSYKVDGYNGALKAIMCSQYHVTPMGSYTVRTGQLRI